jgi:hypothetical protein
VLSLALRVAIGVATAIATVALAPRADAADVDPARNDPEAAGELAPIAGDLRPNVAVGVGPLPEGDGGIVGRVGVDGEYWLSKHVGIGAQLGFQAMTTFDLSPPASGSTWSEHRVSLAPAVTFRGSNPRHFPMVSLALGYSWGHSDSQRYCELNVSDCQPWSASNEAAGLYGSLMGAWLFHSATDEGPGAAFAIGPLVRLDWLTYDNFFQSGFGFSRWGWTLTAGLTIGFGLESKRAR